MAERLAPQFGTRGSQNPHHPETPDLLFRSRRPFRTPTDLFTVDNPLHNRQNARCLRSRCPRRQVHPELLVYTLGAAEEFSHKRWESFSFRAPSTTRHNGQFIQPSSNAPLWILHCGLKAPDATRILDGYHVSCDNFLLPLPRLCGPSANVQ